MSIQRANLLIGPGKITHAAHTYYYKGAAALPVELETVEIGTDAHGPLDKRLLDFNARVIVIPDGAWTSEAQFGLSPQWFTEQPDVLAPPAGGLLPAGLHQCAVDCERAFERHEHLFEELAAA